VNLIHCIDPDVKQIYKYQLTDVPCHTAHPDILSTVQQVLFLKC